jgi:hypothetical protein
LTNSPSEVPEDWFFTQEMVFRTREKLYQAASSRRMLAHYTITPGQDGWLEATRRPREWDSAPTM